MPPLRSFHPTLAALLAVCVVLLGLAAVSPDLHQHLCTHLPAAPCHGSVPCHEVHAGPLGHHHHAKPVNSAPATSSTDEHRCAVTLWAAGCDTPLVFTLAPPSALHAEGVASFIECLLARTLRGPERACGPPVWA